MIWYQWYSMSSFISQSWCMFQCVVSFLPCRAVRTGGLRWIWQAGCSQLTVRDMERPASQAPTPPIHCRWVVSASLCVFVGAGAFPKSQFIKLFCFQTDRIIIFDWCYVWVSLSLPRTHLRSMSFMSTPVRKDSPRYFFVVCFTILFFLYIVPVLLPAHSYACVCGALSKRWMAALAH